MTTEKTNLSFFDRSTNRVVDGVYVKDGVQYGLYSHKTMEQLQFDYGGDIITMDEEEAYQLYLNGFIKPVEETTKDYWWQMLEVLPPVSWVRYNTSESFKLCERTAGNITLIMVRVGDNYYKLEDDIKMSHEDILKKVSEYLENKKAPKGASPAEQAELNDTTTSETQDGQANQTQGK